MELPFYAAQYLRGMQKKLTNPGGCAINADFPSIQGCVTQNNTPETMSQLLICALLNFNS